MKNELELEVFRAGDYGPKGAYDNQALDALAADYDPAGRHEAPVTLDHSQTGPAFGWVSSLRRNGDRLVARLRSLSEEMIGLVRKGAYKKRSIELYRTLPETGRPYLRAVSFLGACAPEVKGLADPVFADAGPVEAIAFEEDRAAGAAEPNAELARRLAEWQRRDREREIEAFCETLRSEGRLLPAWEEMGLRAFLGALSELPHQTDTTDPTDPTDQLRANRGGTEERQAAGSLFNEEAASLPLLEWFKGFLRSLPALLPLGEVAPDHSRELASIKDCLPRQMAGVRIAPQSLALHRRVIALRESEPDLSYSDALRAAARESSN